MAWKRKRVLDSGYWHALNLVQCVKCHDFLQNLSYKQMCSILFTKIKIKNIPLSSYTSKRIFSTDQQNLWNDSVHYELRLSYFYGHLLSNRNVNSLTSDVEMWVMTLILKHYEWTSQWFEYLFTKSDSHCSFTKKS